MIQHTETMQRIIAGMIDCFTVLFRSYPPAAIHIGTAGVAIGVINELRHADCTRIMIPIGFAPIDLQARMAIGMKMIITVRFIMTCVNRNGTMKNTKPIR